MQIQNSVVLVTGANRGLGRELVRALIARGARKVYAAARDPSTIDIAHLGTGIPRSDNHAIDHLGTPRSDNQAIDHLGTPPSDNHAIIPIQLDVTNADDISRLATAAPDVSIVINNAGVSRASSLLGTDAIAAAHAELETNVFGPLAITRALAPALARNGGGAVVNILSVLSWLSLPAVATYSLSKSAAWSMTNGRAKSSRHNTRASSPCTSASWTRTWPRT